jgi:hypothetical protein
MWQWASTEQAWWKEATITTDQQIRSWEMAQHLLSGRILQHWRQFSMPPSDCK